MLRLTLARHGDASFDATTDFERCLTSLGISQATSAGETLSQESVDYLISSPAPRAYSTAKIIANFLPVNDVITVQNAYNADLGDLLSIVQGIDDRYRNILLVGHNPGMSELAFHFVPNHGVHMSTASIFQITFELSNWAELMNGDGQFVFFKRP
jgi:phosphohistidine phosphatase